MALTHTHNIHNINEYFHDKGPTDTISFYNFRPQTKVIAYLRDQHRERPENFERSICLTH